MKEYWRFSQIIAQQIPWRNVDLPNIFYEFIKKFPPQRKKRKKQVMDNSSIFIGVYTSYILAVSNLPMYYWRLSLWWWDWIYSYIGDVFLSLLPIILSLLQLVMVYAVCISFNIMLILILWCWSGCNCADICIWRWYIVAVWHWKLWSTKIYFR